MGQLVYQSTENNLKLETGKLAAGMYGLVLQTDKGPWFEKFIKE